MRLLSDAMELRLCMSGLATAPQEQLEGGRQCPPSSASLSSPSRLQSEALGFGFAQALSRAIMAQLSKCLVVQHGASSSLVAWCGRVDLGTRLPLMC
jgi:hypothetical protein